MMAKFCEKCGTEWDGKSKFCAKCGNPFEGTGEAAAQPVKNSAANSPKPKSKTKEILKIVGGVFGVIVVLCILANGCGSSNNTKKPAASSSSATKQAIQVKAEDMIKDYRTDLASAEAKYKDKEVEVTGQLLHKKQFNNSQDYALVIYATEAGGKSYTVDVDIDKDKVTEANKVKNGDFVNAKGICVGRVEQQNRPEYISVQIQAKSIN